MMVPFLPVGQPSPGLTCAPGSVLSGCCLEVGQSTGGGPEFWEGGPAEAPERLGKSPRPLGISLKQVSVTAGLPICPQAFILQVNLKAILSSPYRKKASLGSPPGVKPRLRTNLGK